MRRPVYLLAAILVSAAAASPAQTPTPTPTPSAATPTPTPGPPTTVASGLSYATEASARVNGVRIEVDDDGAVWFLESSADRVGVLRGTTITYWQLRASDDLGANPVDFIREGNVMWLLESGQGDVPAGHCMIGRLDTTTGALREWDIPGSIPSAFWHAPDGTWWIPQSGGVLQNVNLDTLTVKNYRSTATFAFADGVIGPDGNLWMVDFGNDRIVRYQPGAATETYWVFPQASGLPPNPSQIDFDSHGLLWISERTGARMDRFDPSTGLMDTFYGIADPIHFQIYQDKLYITAAVNPSQVSVLDPRVSSPPVTSVLSSTDTAVLSVDAPNAVPRDLTITPTTFDSSPTAMAASTVVISQPALGTLSTSLDSTSTYGVAVKDGAVWVGTDGKLAKITLQSIGTAPDLSAPSALNLSGPANNRVRSDITIADVGPAAISGDALYMYSEGAFAMRNTISLAAGATQVIPDAFVGLGNGALIGGPVRFRVATGASGDLVAAVRSLRIMPDGGSFGYSERALSGASSLGANGAATLFLGGRADDVTVFGIYSPNGGTGTLTLVAPDGTVRGTRPFDMVQNARLEFNPAASAFGVDAEPGDVIRVAVTQGSVQPYAHILDATSRDVAESTPAFASDDVVFPLVGTVIGGGGLSFITDVFLSNPGTSAANVSIAYYPSLVQGEPLVASLTLAPGESRVLESFLNEVFGITSGQGSILIASNTPVAAGARIAARSAAGDYAGFAPAIGGGAGIVHASATFVGLPQIGFRRTNLILYNRGLAGTITVTGFRADGSATQPMTLAIGDHVSTRIDSVFQALGVSDQAGGRIRVDVPAGMNVYAWTAEVDAITGDVDLAAPDRSVPLP